MQKSTAPDVMHESTENPRSESLDDAIVYRRTAHGQRALLHFDSSSASFRILARVNGFTAMRRFRELAPAEATALTQAIPQLLDDRLIEVVEPPPQHA
jgi:hypothetical protein